MKPRCIYTLTQNPHKYQEYKKIFGEYGISVFQTSVDTLTEMQELLEKEHTHRAIAIINETSNIYNQYGEVSTRDKQLEVVVNKAVLQVFYLLEDELTEKTYTHQIEGYVDLTKKETGKEVFGWDDIFVSKNSQLSLHELKEKNLKISARDIVMSRFIKDFIYYKKRIDLKFNPQGQEKTIDFSNDVYTFMKQNPYLSHEGLKAYRLDHLLQFVAQQGIFFKSPKNRKEKNYWLPSLNAGLPLVPKGDDIHEITFMMHDLMHFVIPDLIYTGEETLMDKKVYIIYRMLSEAITMILADMLFIHCLKESGVSYDFSKRSIYPLSTQLSHSLDRDFEGQLQQLLHANARFALAGDLYPYQQLLVNNETTHSVLEKFVSTYTPFFVEDYKWTEANFKNMQKERVVMEQWHIKHQHLLNQIGVQTITSFKEQLSLTIDEMSHDSLIDEVFRVIFEQKVIPAMKQEGDFDGDKARSLAFKRYMLGQMVIFSKFDFISESSIYENKIAAFLNSKSVFSLEEIERVILLFQQYIDILFDKHLLSEDDQLTFKEMYTIFPAFYVSYDKDKESYERIDQMRDLVLS